jgi:hypothetical protein
MEEPSSHPDDGGTADETHIRILASNHCSSYAVERNGGSNACNSPRRTQPTNPLWSSRSAGTATPKSPSRLSVGERTVQCAPDLQQCVALVHLKPRPWQAAVRLLSEGLEVRLRKVSDAENRWVLERDPQVAARERRWRQRLKAYLVEEAKHTMQLGEEEDYLSELYALFSTSECERLLALRARVNEWLEANRGKYADERALVAAVPLGASEVGESVWQKVEEWVQSRQSALRRRLGVLGEDRGLLVKALLLRVVARIDRPALDAAVSLAFA